MSLLHSRRLRILLPLVIFLFGCFNSPPSPEIVEPQRANVVVMGETAHLAPGSKASFLVQVRDPYAAPGDAILANRQVEVFLDDGAQTQPLFTGHTDDAGLVNVAFLTPEQGESGQQTLIIRAATDGQESVITQDVYIGRAYAVLITTDKPVYQPGQVIHLRTLALDTLDLRAADAQTVTLTVADPQGNKLLQRALPTSQYGVASADFTLDSQATSGDYQITAAIGPNTATRTVEVKPYTLPRFEITFQPDQNFYLPGETATGVIEARYFFGKPVAGGQVVVRGSITDVTRETVFEVTGATDADGLYRYAVPVPDFFVGQLDNQSAQIDLEIEVVDTANHLEAIDETITVAEKPLLIDAVPESGLLRPGLANRVYLDVSTPDGAAAPATLTITGDALAPITTTTDLYGLAVITLTAPDQPFLPLQVAATDDTGRQVTQPLLLGGATGASTTVLMRPERSEYKIGETANIDIYVNGHATTAYLDIIKGQQTFGLVALPVVGGVAQAALPIDGSLLGTLELNAYVIGDDGEMASDRRLLLVNPAPAEIDVTLDADRYRPGDTATLAIQVQRDGAPMPGVVGLAIVDESVFSVQAQAPGFARTYFLLERELQGPRYEIHDFVELEDDVYSPYDNLPSSIRYGARAQELALTGLFAQELAARQPAPAVASTPAAPSLAATLAMSWGNRLYLLAPLVGLALYDGSRKRRRWLIALTIFALGAFFWSACAAPAAAPAMPAAEAPAAESASVATTATQGQAAPRLRQYFPETLYWLPDLETDADGRAQVQVPIADSITTWRVSVLASDRDGNLGSAQTGLRVFQEFFVEPDLPRFLTVGDELYAPISIFNYLDQPQRITLDVAPGDWYELTGDAPRTLEIAANAVTVAYVPIRVLRHGTFDFQITATGSSLSDAVVRTVEVLPDGQQMFDTAGGKLAATQTFSVGVPATAIPGTGRLLVRVYPGVVSQVLEGLEGLLQTPYGCFEQTSSVTYPNVMVLDYLKATGQAAPRIQLQAEQLINLGYQRLLTFEVRGEPGGFSLFGDPPAQMMLTAYGLMEFGDMAGVAYVDPDLMARVAAYLANWQHGDGSWAAEGMTIESGLEDIQSQLATTAYIAWGLADAGYEPRAVDRAVRFIEQALREAPATDAPVSPLASPVGDAASAAQRSARRTAGYDDYTLALAANALLAAGADATPLLNVLEAHATVADGLAVWGAHDVTYLGGYGATAAIETTALVAQALLRADHRPDLAAQAINYLVANRDPNGAFYTTQATVQALKALVLAAHNSGEEGAAHVTVELSEPSGKVSIRTFTVEAGSADVVQQLAFENIGGDANQVQITVEGDRTLHYQLVTSYYLPWRELVTAPETVEPMRVAVRYDRTELRVNETVQALATVELLTPGMAGTVLVDLGIPPGFAPVTADLDALAAQGAIDRYELTGRQIILYLTNVRSGEVLTFAYRLQAKYPIRAQTPASQVFDYYAPDQGSIEPPQRITVTLGTPEE